jgi:hypothetical protein
MFVHVFICLPQNPSDHSFIHSSHVSFLALSLIYFCQVSNSVSTARSSLGSLESALIQKKKSSKTLLRINFSAEI